MKINDVKEILNKIESVKFLLPNGDLIPAHFHVTEVGIITKNFIDCGGTIRSDKVANFQLWTADDFDHRLAPQKFLDIINLSEKILELENLEIEVEYQSNTIGKFGLSFDGANFLLTNKKTDCLDKDKCGIDEPNLKQTSSCSPKSGCC
ncbi:MAG: hypothetical protein CBD21_04765 [bacterium TMED161]|nr:MAG: hypothetical protein CBD21_04765 [bacterium TMED161]|tara:strand:+ start:323 stop:769 length:447 start_codon:yes stop_codon:yes gene_type:complete